MTSSCIPLRSLAGIAAPKDASTTVALVAGLRTLHTGDKSAIPTLAEIIGSRLADLRRRQLNKSSGRRSTLCEKRAALFLPRSAPRPAACLALSALGVALPPTLRRIGRPIYTSLPFF